MAITNFKDVNRVALSYLKETRFIMDLPAISFVTVKPRWMSDLYRWPRNEFEQDMNETMYGTYDKGHDPYNYVGADIVDEIILNGS